MINHTQAEAMEKLSNVLCQVGVTTIIVKFLILDIPIDCDAPIVVAARFDVLRTVKSDSDDEEEYVIKRNKFGAPIYGPKPAPYLNCTNPEDRSSAIQTTLGTHDDEAGSSRSKRSRHETVEEFARRLGLYQAVELEEDGFNVYFEGGLRNDDNFNAHDYWLSISREDNLGLSRSHTSTIRRPILRVIHKMITYGLCQRKTRVLTEDVVRSLSAPIYCRDLDTTTLRDLTNSNGKLIPEDPQPGVPRVGIPRPPRASMQDLYDRMGRMKIRQDAIERMKYRQSYH
ncbi:hypothetical protein Tco_1386091 [Tanacetum coccineum]